MMTVGELKQELAELNDDMKVVLSVDSKYYPLAFARVPSFIDTEVELCTCARQTPKHDYRFHIMWDKRTDHYIGHKHFSYATDADAIKDIPTIEKGFTDDLDGQAHVVEIERECDFKVTDVYTSVWTNHLR